ncbi:hypothetical protein BRARA_F01582 [Brassica rapa]|uniref:Uncharacterized protein n=2 Tax=Brassica TaxID=3705 RepID=A0ABQ8CZZ6_BRANA|nr:uncharacterized protein LOC106347390 [Brassica napus]KAH0922133.1 hypothetical protein HID58_022151 [Brassica napus]RID58276.1 hypothetical protein BRARA_F01582 [Brassica rapa]CAG7869639.1 unnamed protein product [Brassica rapa]VDC66341.1 unnamed protein product [Brassica rapa]
MDMYKDDSSPYCYFHPKEEYVGVCPLCLNERLLVLASKQRSSRTKYSSSSPVINLPKIFTLSSLLSRLDLRHRRKFHPSSDLDVSTSQEDSFISIKFENDGNASWEKKTVSKVCVDNTSSACKEQQSLTTSSTSIIEPNSVKSSLRWRKRIGHLFHVIKLRSGWSTSSRHVASSKVEGTKVRKQGWMVRSVRTLTRRKSRKSKS